MELGGEVLSFSGWLDPGFFDSLRLLRRRDSTPGAGLATPCHVVFTLRESVAVSLTSSDGLLLAREGGHAGSEPVETRCAGGLLRRDFLVVDVVLRCVAGSAANAATGSAAVGFGGAVDELCFFFDDVGGVEKGVDIDAVVPFFFVFFDLVIIVGGFAVVAVGVFGVFGVHWVKALSTAAIAAVAAGPLSGNVGEVSVERGDADRNREAMLLQMMLNMRGC